MPRKRTGLHTWAVSSVESLTSSFTSQKLSPPQHSFLQMVVEIYLLQRSIPLGTFRNMLLKPLTPSPEHIREQFSVHSKCRKGGRRDVSGLRALTILLEDQRLTAIIHSRWFTCKPSSKRSIALFWPQQAMHSFRQTYKHIPTRVLKINNRILFKKQKRHRTFQSPLWKALKTM